MIVHAAFSAALNNVTKAGAISRLLQQLPGFANIREAKEAQRGGVEPIQAACKLLLFDHYIIASHAAPAVHS